MLSTCWDWPDLYKLWTSGEIPTAHLSASSDLYQEKIWILHSELENMKAQLFLAAETFAFEPATPFMDIFLNLFRSPVITVDVAKEPQQQLPTTCCLEPSQSD